MPLWVAPNLITFVGLMANLITTLFVILYDPNISGQVLFLSHVINNNKVFCLGASLGVPELCN